MVTNSTSDSQTCTFFLFRNPLQRYDFFCNRANFCVIKPLYMYIDYQSLTMPCVITPLPGCAIRLFFLTFAVAMHGRAPWFLSSFTVLLLRHIVVHSPQSPVCHLQSFSLLLLPYSLFLHPHPSPVFPQPPQTLLPHVSYRCSTSYRHHSSSAPADLA